MKQITVDGNTAAAKMAYYLNEVSSIYPITPSSTMAELCDTWASENRKNIFGETMLVSELQSEAGVSGAVHGSLSAGCLTTTFTASQGLLLMIPNMYKIAGECLPTVFHVSARSVASHALSIFGDHSDVMACLSTGFNILCSTNVQECLDMSLASQIIALKSSLPFIHFFDGFRTSHEIQKIYDISEDDIKKIFPFDAVKKFKNRALTPENPVQKGTAQNPDVFFQNRERINPLYNNVYEITLSVFKDIEKITNRHYTPFEYYGDKKADKIIVSMGSSFNTIKETVDSLNKNGKKYGAINVRLYRPFNAKAFCETIPSSVKKIAVLDRNKNSGSIGEQLYQDVISALYENNKYISTVGGRYGLGSKEFTPSCVKAVFDNLELDSPKNHFTVGIIDDITNTSLPLPSYDINDDCYELKFYGLGSDGTVSANKNSIKIIGENTDKYVQGYFEYDSKKAGSMTISHLRISSNPILKPYNISRANFIAIHNFSFIRKYDILKSLKENGIVLINTMLKENELPRYLPQSFIDTLKQKNAKLYTINALKIADSVGLLNKINIIMQTAFFSLTNFIPFDLAKQKMEKAIIDTYSKKGEDIVNKNIKAITLSENSIYEIDYSNFISTLSVDNNKTGNKFYDNIIAPVEKRQGDTLPVSCFSIDGTIPTDTAKYLKRGIASSIPEWIPDNCIQCGFCTISCPHGAIRSVLVDENDLVDTPNSFVVKDAFGVKGAKFRIQISPEDCTGCGVCVNSCPALKKAISMTPIQDIIDREKKNYEYSLSLKRRQSPFPLTTTKGIQFKKPYFEYNFACAGCGETPYIKIASQLFGDRMIIANATGCSSIYGGSFPACPYAKDDNGHGPTWANSLFEDNAEFGLGISYSEKQKLTTLKNKVEKYKTNNDELKTLLLNWLEKQDCTYKEKEQICKLLKEENNVDADDILLFSDSFVKKSIWIIGGDGWAYDIGYGGLDHLLSSNENVNVLVLDSEVYSNTGGQSSKSTPKGSSAKFANNGKSTKKKNLAQIAMANNNAYVASISLGADYNQTIKALNEAEKFDGPSLIIAYAPCINHGFNMADSQKHMLLAVETGYWNLFRYNPNQEKPLTIDSPSPTKDYMDFLNSESRYTAIKKKYPERAKILFEESKTEAINRRKQLEKLLDD